MSTHRVDRVSLQMSRRDWFCTIIMLTPTLVMAMVRKSLGGMRFRGTMGGLPYRGLSMLPRCFSDCARRGAPVFSSFQLFSLLRDPLRVHGAGVCFSLNICRTYNTIVWLLLKDEGISPNTGDDLSYWMLNFLVPVRMEYWFSSQPRRCLLVIQVVSRNTVRLDLPRRVPAQRSIIGHWTERLRRAD